MSVLENRVRLSGLVLMLSGLAAITAPVAAEPSGYTLERVVILSRHGVRSPTKQTQLMNDVTPDKWPQWPVKAGYLTPRGAELVTLMGGFYGDYFRSLGLLAAGCPAEGVVYAQADIDQRTRLTGQAFLDGLAPGCGLTVHNQADLKKTDPLFHPVEAGVCKLDAVQTDKAIEEQLGGPLDTVSQRYAKPFAQMGDVLNFAASPYCKSLQQQGKTCDFAHFAANEVNVNKEGTKVTLSGPLALSSTLGEIFLLQNAQAMPVVAWQRLKGAENWVSLLSLHNAQFNLMAKTPYIARHKGTPLLQQIDTALTLQLDAQGQKLPISAQNRVLFLGGHDTNIANIAGMLGADWQLPEQPDNTPPGGGLVFELWQNPDNHQRYVAVKMFYQTMDQLRNAEKLDLKNNPAGIISVAVAGCENNGEDKLCELDTFQKKVVKVIEPACHI
ncbi:AppA family phytase/histidine-type acid phosphatase [Yersinia similis]|uniref:AppA family phytase/histidine-type acid phosphatase n=1 Tax=Yersinia similis TaxID=367190 RepID=UPI0005DDD3E2|nr:AppA family phytase/histidine-type acid phosphatase [Yersinia similis]CNC27210.1 phosphoanhydride phosphorylase [Yersinia similis]CNE98832.1 phosphoanhydride phosphorylase [Yersinia similis]